MLVSAIIPVRDGAAFLAQAIRSVQDQTWDEVEVIVVDDGSTDDSAGIAAGFDGVRVLHQTATGVSAARNRAVAASRGELLAFLDADDLWPPRKLELQAGHLRDHPRVDAVLGRQRLFVEAGVALPPWVRDEGGIKRANGSSHAVSIVTRREVWNRVGPFTTSLAFGEDTDWLLRAHELGVRIEMLEEVVLHRRIHGANATYNEAEMRRGLALVLKARIDRRRAAG